jgi:hypothetical protein
LELKGRAEGRKKKERVWDDGSVNFLDGGDSFTDVYLCSKFTNYILFVACGMSIILQKVFSRKKKR